MLFPDKMVRVGIAIEHDHADEVLERIGEMGVLHIDMHRQPHENALEESRVHTLQHLAQKQMKLLGIAPSGHATVRVTQVEPLLREYEVRLQASGEEIGALETALGEAGRETERFEKAQTVINALAPDIDLPRLAEALRRIEIRVGIAETEKAELLHMAMMHKGVLAVMRPLFAQTAAVALFFDADDAADVTAAFNAFKVSEIERKYLLRSAFEVHGRREAELKDHRRVLSERYGGYLRETEGALRDLSALENAKTVLSTRGGKLLLGGWIPKKEASAFASGLPYTEVTFSEAQADAPVLLRTPAMLRPFETLVGSFSCPRYGEVNPVLPFAVTFLILFGIMFGDVGHGLVLAAGGWGVKQRLKHYADLGQIFFLSGLSAAFFGLLYGSVFGVHDLMPHLLFTPIENISATLVFSIGIGVAMITVSFLLHMVTALKRRELTLLFASEGSLLWLLVYWFTIGIFVKLVVQEMNITYESMLLAGLLLSIFILTVRKKHEKGAALVDLVREFADTLTNTISFVRVGAFALAHGALFMAVFSIARIISESQGASLFYWMAIIFGNIVIIVLEGVVVTIQTLRLEYYEFFKRFFRGGGTPYTPFNLGGKDAF